jgi:uncharacterized membrane protein
MNTTTHPLVDDYLRRLHRAARVLPRHQSDELVAEIRSHFDAGLAPDASEAEVRNLLDDLGPPEAVVAAAQPDRSPSRRGPREICALLLLLTGFPPVLGWLVGVMLLLWSPLWSARQKLLAILVWPGGYLLIGLGASVAALSTSESCPVPASGSSVAAQCAGSEPSSWPLVLAVIIFVVAPLLVMTYLYRAAGRPTATD